MSEVSCRVLDAFFRALARKQLPAALLVKGIDHPVEHLTNRHERIEWSQFVVFMENCAAIWTQDELVQIGGSFLRSPFLRPLTLVARLLYSTLDFYRWILKEQHGSQDFRCVSTEYVEPDQSRIFVTLRIDEGYEPCRPFFHVSKGTLQEMPRIVGGGTAHVDMHIDFNQAVYEIAVPRGGGTLAFVRRAIMWPFAARATARELTAAHAVLQERCQELEVVRSQLARQKTQLETAYSISQLIHQGLDLQSTLQSLAKAMVEVAGFCAAEVALCADLEGRPLQRSAQYGMRPDGREPISIPISLRGREVGTIDLWPPTNNEKQERLQLLEYAIPAVCLALDDALTFTSVLDYRNNLEHKVKERTSALEQAMERLREAQSVRDRIFANINHEIRTPLSLIRMATDDISARERGSITERSKRRLNEIDHNIERLLRLVDGLLLLAAKKEGKLRLQSRKSDVTGLLKRSVSSWTPIAERKRITLSYDGPDSFPATLDEAFLERIVTNLVSNAIKFTPEDGEVRVILTGDSTDKIVIIEVHDSGPGVPVDHRERIFERFEQGPPASRSPEHGSGIGLAIVKELTEAHGGTVNVETGINGGSVFRLSLPRQGRVSKPMDVGVDLSDFTTERHPATSFGPAPHVADRPAAVSDAAMCGTVLVAEDNQDLCSAIGELLSKDYRVFLAHDGLEALEVAQRTLPDLLITDVGMPGMDGFELTRHFRAMPGNRLAPVILLTAYASIENRLTGFDAGAVDYVLKPFHPGELLARVRSQLHLRSMALRLHEREKLAALGTLSAGLAHELRNPANAVVNAVEPLREVLPPEVLERSMPAAVLLDAIETGAVQIASLCRDLLGLARPGTLTRRPEDVASVLNAALRMVEAALEGIRVDVDIQEDMYVSCSGPLIVQVLTNLLENAAQAVGSGGWIGVVVRQDGSDLEIQISDSGPGVSPMMREKIFEPFYTTKEPGRGTGLGLTVSRIIAERHGGRLDLVETPRGHAFQLALPMDSAVLSDGASVDLTLLP